MHAPCGSPTRALPRSSSSPCACSPIEIEVMRVFRRGELVQFRLHGHQHRPAGLRPCGNASHVRLRGRVRAQRPTVAVHSPPSALAPSMALAHTSRSRFLSTPSSSQAIRASSGGSPRTTRCTGSPFSSAGSSSAPCSPRSPRSMPSAVLLEHAWLGPGRLRSCSARCSCSRPSCLVYPLVGLRVLPALLCCVSWGNAKARFYVSHRRAVLCLAWASWLILGPGAVRGLRVSDFKPESDARNFPDAKLLYDLIQPAG